MFNISKHSACMRMLAIFNCTVIINHTLTGNILSTTLSQTMPSKHIKIIYFNTVSSTQDRDAEATTPVTRLKPNLDERAICTCDSSISPSEVVAWVLVSILTVLFTGLLSVLLLWMVKKRQTRDTITDNSSPKYEMEGNLCYEATAVKQTTDTHLYATVTEGGAK